MHDSYRHRVRFAETDQQGVVFYGEYVTYQDEAVSAYMDAIGYGWATTSVEERGWDTHVVNVELDYHTPARFPDELVGRVRVRRIGGASLTFDYELHRERDDELLATGSVTHVVVDGAGEPMRVPDPVRAAIDDHQAEPPEQ